MPKTKISEYSTTNSSNTDIESINIDEGCAPSGINNAIRELMVHLKEFQTGSSGDPLTVAGTFVASGGATLSGTNTLSGSTVMTASAGTSASPSIHFSSDTNTGIFSPAADTIAFAEGGVEAMRIDSSGRVGIGTTSPAFRLTSVGGRIQLSGGTTSQEGVAIQRISGAATITGINNDNNAYNALTFATGASEAMRIDTSGNVGIGTSSPARKLTISGSGAFSDTTTAALQLNNTSTSRVAIIDWDNSEVLNIWAAGAVADNGTIRFLNGGGSGTERMRIDSSGNVSIGNTTASGRLHVERSDNSDTFRVNNTNASFSQDLIRTNTTRAANSAFNILRLQANLVDQMYVTGAGVIYAQNTTIQSISDIRTKENIRDSRDGLSVITALRPVRFDFKEGFGNDRKNQLGFIAQEVEPVFPDAVSEWKQGDEAYKSVGPGALIPVLVKAIQELSAKNAALEARIATLEGN